MKVQHISLQIFPKITFKGRSEDSYFAKMAKDMFSQKPDSFEKIDTDDDDFGSMMSSRDSALRDYADVEEIEQERKTPSINLSRDFQNVLEHLSIEDPFSENIKLMKAYENREYHNLSHVENMLFNFNAYEDLTHQKIPNRDIFKLAVYMHDYYNGSINDVEDSAIYARNLLENSKSSKSKKLAPQLTKLILATTHSRDLSNASNEEKIISDLDLAVLASEPDEYNDYSRKIRKEFKQFNDEEFAKGRIKILEKLLKKEQIFYTPFFSLNYESRARDNMKQELENLKNNKIS